MGEKPSKEHVHHRRSPSGRHRGGYHHRLCGVDRLVELKEPFFVCRQMRKSFKGCARVLVTPYLLSEMPDCDGGKFKHTHMGQQSHAIRHYSVGPLLKWFTLEV